MQADVAKENGIDLVFFHGKGKLQRVIYAFIALWLYFIHIFYREFVIGWTVVRGGSPATFKAILSHAPDTINGQFRVTEQVRLGDIPVFDKVL